MRLDATSFEPPIHIELYYVGLLSYNTWCDVTVTVLLMLYQPISNGHNVLLLWSFLLAAVGQLDAKFLSCDDAYMRILTT